VLLNVFETVHEVLIGEATPLLLDGVCESLTETSASGRVRSDNHIALFSKDSGVPPGTPTVCPCPLWSSVDEVGKRIFLIFLESGRFDDPGLDRSIRCSARKVYLTDLIVR